ncbi:PSMD8 [Mytilus coruscus]|uniref:PSMD8 n=1 Tax=Mytilus coruscus TaxID=42192 RepID=A0A6J8AHS0_MYTCO|nr:PSMD8 [Mytilus coruscus]
MYPCNINSHYMYSDVVLNGIWVCSLDKNERAANPQNSGPTPQQIQQQLLALNHSPYGDSPLFWNLKQTETKREDLLKPTNPIAQKAVLTSQFKVSPRPTTRVKPKSLHNVLNGSKELELLPVKELQNNIYIKHPVSMEQYLMEGSYNKVFLAKGNVPAENYTFFINILLNTIRNEIASCIEKAYEKLALQEAARMLFFESVKPMKEYAVQRGWTLASDSFFYFQQEKKVTDESIPAMQLAEQTIEYARELEMIV